jgi:hypothetical protein
MLLLYKAFVCQLYWCMQTKFHFKILKVDEFHERLSNSMDQFRNDVTLWVKHLRGRYDAIFIEPENVNKISWAVKMSNICIICQNEHEVNYFFFILKIGFGLHQAIPKLNLVPIKLLLISDILNQRLSRA